MPNKLIRWTCLIAASLIPSLVAAQSAKPATNSAATWKTECAACHMAYPAGLLPQRSWQKMMSGLEKHFGADASLSTAVTAEITAYLVNNSAEKNTSRRSAKFLQSIAPAETPLRISDTAYFEKEHRKVVAETWKLPKVGSKANCNACHSDADAGEFSGKNTKIPQ